MTELWESIFIPGPTPTLLRAANVTFGILQILLAVLLYATYSVHFVALSIISAGLWWSINWFARELRLAKEEQKRQEEWEEKEKEKADTARLHETEDSDTEVEGKSKVVGQRRSARKAAAAAKAATAGSAEVEPLEKVGELTQRSGDGTQSSVSTEDEWEKISENEQEKDK